MLEKVTGILFPVSAEQNDDNALFSDGDRYLTLLTPSDVRQFR